MFIQISLRSCLINKKIKLYVKNIAHFAYCIMVKASYGESKSPARMTQEPKANNHSFLWIEF